MSGTVDNAWISSHAEVYINVKLITWKTYLAAVSTSEMLEFSKLNGMEMYIYLTQYVPTV